MSERTQNFVVMLLVVALVCWGSAMVMALLIGLFNPVVDNEKIFSILGPISQNVSSAAISIVSAALGYKIGTSKGEAS